MDITAFTHRSRWAALLAAVPLLAACGGDPGARLDGAPPALGRGSQLVITTDNGVRLRPAGDDRAVTEARIESRWSHRDDTWVLDLSCPRPDKDGDHEDGPCPRMPSVGIPAGVPVTVTARNAGIDVAGVATALDLTTVNGDVTVTRSGLGDATVRLATRNGSVRAGALSSARLHAETVNGDVTLGSTTAPSRVDAATTNGSVRVALPADAPAYVVDATTRNGRTSVAFPSASERNGHDMTLATVNGDVTAKRG
ncbi:DUF4097 family beta strand repeat-containing protein [Streptomyces sp. QL37]|uniref:DUF4097 family beta strand repeat-containing protein n=1 Tax=Streptomyces sp. QL37 TaxID=2093747 RepID=UPI000CF28958|nr:DUF4097 family beta strand repeat-containing protein [Streptomyces sp. QL37]PPQ59924.1 hypothetical protein C5F59_27065 [Streptomyces sp. QL37]